MGLGITIMMRDNILKTFKMISHKWNFYFEIIFPELTKYVRLSIFCKHSYTLTFLRKVVTEIDRFHLLAH